MTNTIGFKHDAMAMVMAVVMAVMMLFTIAPVGIGQIAEATTACPGDKYRDFQTGEWYKTTASGGTKMSDAETKACKELVNPIAGKIMGFITILSSLAFVFAFGMVVYGGVKYISSQGEERQTEEAKKQMWNAGIGCLIIASSFVIFKLIMNAVGGGS